MYTGTKANMCIPMGYIELLPGFEHVPIVVIAGSDTINIVNLSDDHMEPLILAESTVAFG